MCFPIIGADLLLEGFSCCIQGRVVQHRVVWVDIDDCRDAPAHLCRVVGDDVGRAGDILRRPDSHELAHVRRNDQSRVVMPIGAVARRVQRISE